MPKKKKEQTGGDGAWKQFPTKRMVTPNAKFERIRDIFNVKVPTSKKNLEKLKQKKNSSRWKRRENRISIIQSFN